MDRQIVYPGQIPLETDLLNSNKYALIGLAKLAAAVLGTHTLLNGLGCAPVSPAALQVQLGAGEIYALANLDGTAYSSLAADTAHSLLKQGLLLDAVTLDCPPPATAGDSVVYLVQIGYFDQDSGATALPYYNAANPAQAYSGPNNSGTAQHTVRQGICQVTVKAGIAATSGSQAAPAPDPGYVGAYLVTVANGQTAITAADIQIAPAAPFITETLTQKISQASGDARYATQSGVQETSYSAANAGGTADALTAGYTPAITALTHGMTLYVRAAAANATPTPTYTPNSGVIAAKAIVKGDGLALVAGDIAGAGHWIALQYDMTLNQWVLLNPAHGVTRGQQLFTSGGTFTPTGDTVYVSMSGGGGGGGGGSTNASGAYIDGGGGGGGDAVLKQPISVTPGVPITITCGAGGSGGAGATNPTDGGNGSAGGTSSFGTYLSCSGGGGGGGALVASNGGGFGVAGGAGGANGGSAVYGSTAAGGSLSGCGGGSMFGAAPGGRNGGIGNPGGLYGGGGAGGSGSQYAGGNGADGFILVEWW